MSEGRIKISELPEAALARDDDIFIIETDTTTQKISLGSLIHYIKEHEEIADYFVKASHLTDTNNPHALTKAQIGLSDVDNTSDAGKPVSVLQRAAMDAVYADSNAYTDAKIAELINGAPSTLDTLGEIAAALQNGNGIGEALEAAIGTKASQSELDSHTADGTLHVTASERANWNNKMESSADAGNTTVTFSEASSLSHISTGEKTSSIIGKISKAISSLIEHIASKATLHEFGHVKLSDTYQNTITNEEAATGIGASQKALAEVYSVLNGNLGNCTFSVQSDGAYVTYTPEGGADAVTKKLGSGGKIKSQYLGSAPNYIYQSTPDGGRTYVASTTLPDSYIGKNLLIFAQGLNSKTSAAASPNLYLPYAGGQVSLSINDGTFDPTQITRIGVTQLFIES